MIIVVSIKHILQVSKVYIVKLEWHFIVFDLFNSYTIYIVQKNFLALKDALKAQFWWLNQDQTGEEITEQLT